MSSSIKDLLDFSIVKKRSKCGIVQLKINFHKDRKSKDGYPCACIKCVNTYTKNYFLANRDKISQSKKKYNEENKEQIKQYKKEYYQENKERIIRNVIEYDRNRFETDVNYRLIKNTRRRIHHALKGETKSSSSRETLGIDIETYKRWIQFQMTPEMNWNNIHVDHVRSISSFDVSNDEELLQAFNWKNTQPLLKEDNLGKGSNELDYQLRFIKAYEFLKLNGETTTD